MTSWRGPSRGSTIEQHASNLDPVGWLQCPRGPTALASRAALLARPVLQLLFLSRLPCPQGTAVSVLCASTAAQPTLGYCPALMAVGDHIKVQRRWHWHQYWHHGIDVGYGHVVSISPEGVLLQSLEKFCEGRPVLRVAYKPGKVPFTPSQIARRALLYMGALGPVPRGKYCLLAWNCEQFSVFCCTGIWLSQQVAVAGAAACSMGLPLLGALFPPLAVTGLVVGTAGGLILAGGVCELIQGHAPYVP